MKAAFTSVWVILVLAITQNVQSAEFCVGTVAELRSALATAESNFEADDIRLELGNYATGGLAFEYTDGNGQDLKISGGWIDFFGNDCGIQTPNEHFQTVIDGDGVSRGMDIALSGNADLEVNGLTFTDGFHVNSGGGLSVTKLNGLNTGVITIANNAFLNNEAMFNAAMRISGAATIHVRNNLVIANHANNVFAVSVTQSDANGIYFNNNTVIGNTAVNGQQAGVHLYVDGSSSVLVANNILNGNDDTDLQVVENGSGNFYLYNNNVDQTVMSSPQFNANNFNKPNRFQPGLLNFVPAANSPLLDAGRTPCGQICPFPTPFVNNWQLGDTDILAQLRVQGGAVDIGAFESSEPRDLIFWDRFE